MNRLTHEQAVSFFETLYGGVHHIPGKHYGGKENVRPWGPGSWRVVHYGDLATFDFDMLTRLVLLAHDQCVRAAILPSAPGRIGIGISARVRVGDISARHPTIDEALAKFRERDGRMA